MNGRCVLLFAFNGFAGKVFAIFLVLCLSVIPAFPKDTANVVPPGNWGAVEYLPQGTKISVRMTFGDRMDGRFLGLDSENIRLAIDEKDRIYPRNDVAEVWRLRVPDRKLNGTLIGLGVGAAGGIASIVILANVKTNGPVYWDEEAGAFLVAGALVGAGIGALVGAIVDASIKEDKLIYRAR